ncbi:hypothetical protein, conserved [Eimeria acervulina]|uniref:Uncharacterized protein n=1 Tax=Eimeria acervulina TaxID=5801 RepID=U6GG57_EIMAC|nr:hypothetical protein, conserved [Eimeria acervulina]CDI79241.1 hypothetical protein, conserved [Eimeria acervulina]
MRLCPLFLGLHADGSLSVLPFWGAIKYSLSFELLPGRGKFHSLSALLLSLENSRSFIPPLVLFPEGQKSNGSCLLQWDARGLDAAAFARLKSRVALLGCMHTPDQGNTQAAATARTGWRRPTYTAPHTVNSPLWHLLLLLLQPRQHLRCIWVPPEDVLTSQQQQQRQHQQLLQKQQQQLLLPQQSLLLQQQQQQQGDLTCIRTTLLRAVPGLVSVKKSGRDLKAFSDYWNEQQQKGRSTKRA